MADAAGYPAVEYTDCCVQKTRCTYHCNDTAMTDGIAHASSQMAMPMAPAHPHSVAAVCSQSAVARAGALRAAAPRAVVLQVPVLMAVVLRVLAHARQRRPCPLCLTSHCFLHTWVASCPPDLDQRLVRVVPTSGQTALASPPRRSHGRRFAAASTRRPVDSPQSPSCNNLRRLRLRPSYRRCCEYQPDATQKAVG